MEALIPLLADLLLPFLVAIAVLGVQLTILVIDIIVSLVLDLARSRPPSRQKATVPARRVGRASIIGLAMTFAALLLANFVFLEPIARFALARIGDRSGTELDFGSASGNLFAGTFTFEDVTARRVSEKRSSFDLKARRLRADLDLATLLLRPIAFTSVEIEGVSGTIRRPERRSKPDDSDDAERLAARRRFQIRDLRLAQVDVALSRGAGEPVAVAFDTVDAQSFRSNYAVFDLLFRANVTGRIDGRAITISTHAPDAKADGLSRRRLTEWRMPDLKADSVSRLVGRPPVGWLRDGSVAVGLDVHIEEGPASLARKTDMRLDWDVRMRGISVRPAPGAGLVERGLALPVTGYIKAKNGDVDWAFKLAMREKQFENMSSLDLRALWSTVLDQMRAAIANRFGRQSESGQ